MIATSILERFEAQAALTPHAAALAGDGCEVSYRELNVAADRLAKRLVDRGVRPAQPVVLALPRGALSVVAGLAVLKAGATFLTFGEEYG